MPWYDYLIIASLVAFVLLVIILDFVLKKKRKSLSGDCTGNCASCGGNCSGCGHHIDCKKLLDVYHKANEIK